MELKKIFFTVLFCYFASVANAEMINPNQKLLPYDVIKIQLEALKNNDKEDNGIKQTWLFAHPKNKMITGPYERFRIMIYGQQYRSLLNHDSHKINLIINTNIKYIFKVEILNKDKNLLFYEWHVEKGSEKNCNNCWFTSVVSAPIDQGNTI
tara:strand:+ start:107 stop:562 length:456 start_codon:yes stop_codon:yes gene_type:complete